MPRELPQPKATRASPHPSDVRTRCASHRAPIPTRAALRAAPLPRPSMSPVATVLAFAFTSHHNGIARRHQTHLRTGGFLTFETGRELLWFRFLFFVGRCGRSTCGGRCCLSVHLFHGATDFFHRHCGRSLL